MTVETRPPRVVIVGSGPAGVSVAWPLVEAGIEVLMLDGDDGSAIPVPPDDTIGALMRGPNFARVMYGDVPPVPGPIRDRSPKMATPQSLAVTARFREQLGLATKGFF